MDKNEILYDVRTLKNYMRRGVVTPKEYQTWLDSLPDEAQEGVETETVFQPTWADRETARTRSKDSSDN